VYYSDSEIITAARVSNLLCGMHDVCYSDVSDSVLLHKAICVLHYRCTFYDTPYHVNLLLARNAINKKNCRTSSELKQESCAVTKMTVRYISGLNEPLRRSGRAYLGAYGTPFWGEWEVVGVSDGTIRKSDGDFL